MEVLASKDRVMPGMPGRKTAGGGCQLQMMSYEAQFDFKEQGLHNLVGSEDENST